MSSVFFNISFLFFFLMFKFQTYVLNDFHDVLMMSINLSDIAISKIHDIDDHCIMTRIFKSEAANSLQKGHLNKTKWNIIKHKKIIFTCKNRYKNFNVS